MTIENIIDRMESLERKLKNESAYSKFFADAIVTRIEKIESKDVLQAEFKFYQEKFVEMDKMHERIKELEAENESLKHQLKFSGELLESHKEMNRLKSIKEF